MFITCAEKRQALNLVKINFVQNRLVYTIKPLFKATNYFSRFDTICHNILNKPTFFFIR